MTILTSLGLIVLALLRTPLFAIIAAAALLGFYRSDIDLTAVPIEFYRLAETVCYQTGDIGKQLEVFSRIGIRFAGRECHHDFYRTLIGYGQKDRIP